MNDTIKHFPAGPLTALRSFVCFDVCEPPKTTAQVENEDGLGECAMWRFKMIRKGWWFVVDPYLPYEITPALAPVGSNKRLEAEGLV